MDRISHDGRDEPYDAAGRQLTRVADGVTLTSTYDANGNRLTASDGTLTITATYDHLGRPLTVDDEDAGTTADTTYTYHLTSPAWTDPTGSYAGTLDAFDRVTGLNHLNRTGFRGDSGRRIQAATSAGEYHLRVTGAAHIPDLDLARIRRYCALRIPARVADQVRLEVDVTGYSVTILECRPPWRPDLGPTWTRQPIARLRYTRSREVWSLIWRDQHGRFHRYDLIEPTADVGALLAEIDADPTSIFWG